MRRIKRIVPLYWMVTLATVAVGYAGVSFGASPTVAELIKSMFFIAFENPEQGRRMVPVVGVGWTLNLEMAFYAIFALTLLIPLKFRFWTVIAAQFAIFLVPVIIGDGSQVLDFYGNNIVLEFAAGVAIGSIYLSGRILPSNWLLPTFLILTVPLVSFILPASIPRLLRFGIPAVAIVYGTLAYEKFLFRSPVALLLGSASYSIYLTHKTAVLFLFTLSLHGMFPKQAILAWPLVSIFAVAFGILTYQFVERPFLSSRQKNLPSVPGNRRGSI